MLEEIRYHQRLARTLLWATSMVMVVVLAMFAGLGLAPLSGFDPYSPAHLGPVSGAPLGSADTIQGARFDILSTLLRTYWIWTILCLTVLSVALLLWSFMENRAARRLIAAMTEALPSTSSLNEAGAMIETARLQIEIHQRRAEELEASMKAVEAMRPVGDDEVRRLRSLLGLDTADAQARLSTRVQIFLAVVGLVLAVAFYVAQQLVD